MEGGGTARVPPQPIEEVPLTAGSKRSSVTSCVSPTVLTTTNKRSKQSPSRSKTPPVQRSSTSPSNKTGLTILPKDVINTVKEEPLGESNDMANSNEETESNNLPTTLTTNTVSRAPNKSNSTQQTFEMRTTSKTSEKIEISKVNEYLARAVPKAFPTVNCIEDTHTPTANTENESQHSHSVSSSIYDNDSVSKSFVPNNMFLRGVLLHCFHMNKKAAESHRMLVEVYGEHALAERTCQKWFARFKSGNFDLGDEERSGPPTKFDYEELEALLEEDPSQVQEELAKTLGVTQPAISHRLKAMGMVRRVGTWVPDKLTTKDMERRFSTCEQLLQRQNTNGFLNRIVTGDEKWIHYDNPKRRAMSGYPSLASSSPAKPNIHGEKTMLCIWWDQLGVVYYELLQPNQRITGEVYQQQLMRLSQAFQEKRPQASRQEKVILQLDNALPHVAAPVKTYLEKLNWEILLHPPYSPDISPSQYHLFRSLQHDLANQHFSTYEEVQKWTDAWIATKEPAFFWDGIHQLPKRWEKVVSSKGQYFEN